MKLKKLIKQDGICLDIGLTIFDITKIEKKI